MKNTVRNTPATNALADEAEVGQLGKGLDRAADGDEDVLVGGYGGNAHRQHLSCLGGGAYELGPIEGRSMIRFEVHLRDTIAHDKCKPDLACAFERHLAPPLT